MPRTPSAAQEAVVRYTLRRLRRPLKGGPQGPFFVCARCMRNFNPRLYEKLAPLVRGMGFELVGVEYHPNSKNALLRIYIDAEAGVDVDDCADVSHQVSGWLDVEDPISGHYTLEVSSPGLDRPLFLAEHFERFAGHAARIALAAPLAERGGRRFKGVLRGLDEAGRVVLEVDGEALAIGIEQIDKARLEPEI